MLLYRCKIFNQDDFIDIGYSLDSIITKAKRGTTSVYGGFEPRSVFENTI